MIKKITMLVMFAVFSFATFADESAPGKQDVENLAVQSAEAASTMKATKCSDDKQKKKSWSEFATVFSRDEGSGCTCTGTCAGPLCLPISCDGSPACCQRCFAKGCLNCLLPDIDPSDDSP